MSSHDTDRTPVPIVVAFGSVGLPLAALLIAFNVYLPRYLVALGMPFATVGACIAIVRLLDVGLDPVIGLCMDRTQSPIGRYRPWLIAGTPVLMLGIYRLLLPAGAVHAGYLIFWLLVAYAGYSVLVLGVAAWGAVIAKSYDNRSRLYGWTQGLAVMGTVLLLLLPLFTHGRIIPGNAASMPSIGLLLIAAFPLMVAICTAVTPERLAPTSGSSAYRFNDYRLALLRPTTIRIALSGLALALGPATTAPIYVYFFKDVKGFTVAETGFLLMFYIGAGIVGSPFWGALARRISKHRALQLSTVLYAVAQTTLMALPRVWPHHGIADALPTVAGMFAVGFCASAFLALIRALIADVVDEVRFETGKDLTSQIFAVVTTVEKAGVAIAVSIIFPILQLVGFDGRENAVNTPSAIFGLEMCYLFAPIILVLLGGAAFFGYRLDSSRHAEIRLALEARDFAASLESIIGPLPADATEV